MKRIFITFFCLLISDLISYNVFGQIGLGGGGGGGVAGGNFGMPKVDISNIIPKTPQADQLIKINEVSVNMARGIPNISYNLYTAKVGNLSIPITLNYEASGIKVDDVPTAVGLKWVLSAGGEIARSINGRPDETGYFGNSNTYTSNYFASLNYGYASVQDLMNSIETNSIDISHDQYSYNYLDRSGDFFFKSYNFIDGKNPNTVKIQTSDFSNLQDFTIADDHGNKAYFGNYNEVTFPNYGGQGYITPNVPSDGITAWKLNTLTAYTGEQATFNYQSYSYS
ncbi:MAG: hypothetical protein KGO81_01035, partial [Bacteroidota bacterium]|nr:hypothetical protein [Bacteroidota bacterium]